MTNRTIALINALTLVVFAGWAYLEKSAPTALIPVFLGNLIWIIARRLNGDNAKQAFNILLILTAITFIALFMPLSRQLKNDDTMGVIRSGIMLLMTGIALVVYTRSYLANKNAV